jgi:1,5-anhydro-D-fructose reductase (1,5-anhydro-D-mannitol-forming)
MDDRRNKRRWRRNCVCLSSDAERGRRYADEFRIPRSTTSLSDLLGDDIDTVYIATTNERHQKEWLAAAAAGKHVLCEKALATTRADAQAMVSACRSAHVVLATNHHLRNAATHRAIRKAIVDGLIGRPLAVKVVHAVSCRPICTAGG